jgi:hypothetical protein
LELNRLRAEEERLSGEAAEGKGKGKPKAARKASAKKATKGGETQKDLPGM